jgi:hypothetical protein
VTTGGVPHDDMPNIQMPGRRDTGPLTEAALAALLAGTEPPVEAAPPLRPVVDVLAALRAGPAGDELAGEAMALAEFRRSAGGPAVSPPARRRRRPLAGPLLGARAAIAAAVAAVTLGGLATAAYAGVLPGPMQRFAHETIGAPAAHGGSPAVRPPGDGHLVRHTNPVGPAVTGAAGHGLCTAYAHAQEHGTAVQRGVALRNLVKAAGGASHVTAYCRAVPDPGRSHQPHPGKHVAHGQGGKQGGHGQGDQNGQGGKHGKGGKHGQGNQNGQSTRGGQNGQGGQQGNGRPHKEGPPGKRSGHHAAHSHGKHSAHRTGRGEHHHANRPEVALLRIPHGTERSPRART